MSDSGLIQNNIKENLHNFSVDELLDLEEAIVAVLKDKIKNKQFDSWQEAFLSVSEWKHLKDDEQIRVDGWNIETF
ncbi:MAG TPA: hypothetical protein ENK21_07930 [Trueperaceae bacterium]|nr:hypothetical protein [Trueperaceae bacterium]